MFDVDSRVLNILFFVASKFYLCLLILSVYGFLDITANRYVNFSNHIKFNSKVLQIPTIANHKTEFNNITYLSEVIVLTSNKHYINLFQK